MGEEIPVEFLNHSENFIFALQHCRHGRKTTNYCCHLPLLTDGSKADKIATELGFKLRVRVRTLRLGGSIVSGVRLCSCLGFGAPGFRVYGQSTELSLNNLL